MAELENLISTVGFPIFMCVYMMKQNRKIADSFAEAMVSVSASLNDLTDMLQTVNRRLEGYKNED